MIWYAHFVIKNSFESACHYPNPLPLCIMRPSISITGFEISCCLCQGTELKKYTN